MADSKLTDLTAATKPASASLLYVVTDPAGSPLSQKTTITDVARAGPSAKVVLTSGNITFNNTSWTEISASLRLTIAAASGDRILVGAHFFADLATQGCGVEAFTLDVSNARVTAFTAGGASDFGSPGWFCPAGASPFVQLSLGGSPAPLTLVSGDIVSGNVKVGFFYRQGTGANGTFRASSTIPFVVWGVNLGPA